MHFWNHDVCPDYLRTKLTPELENEEAQLENERNMRGVETVCSYYLLQDLYYLLLLFQRSIITD